MLVECTNCGAPLDVKPDDRVVTCRYCDRTNRVRSMRTVAMETPKTWAPPPAWRPPENVPAKSSRELRFHRGVKHRVTESGGNRPASCLGCLTFVFVLLPIGISLGVNPELRSLIGLLGGVDTDAAPLLGAAPLTPPSGSRSFDGVADGEVPASRLHDGCVGNVSDAPHLAIQTHEPVFVTAVTRSQHDLVLVVRSADGTFHCDDDSGGDRQPRISTALPAGVHQLWVGPLNSSAVGPFALDLEWQHLGAMPGPDGLAQAAPPALGTFDPGSAPTASWMGSTRGVIRARRLGTGCEGAVPPVPHLVVHAAGPTLVTLSTTARDDLVLFVRSPDGTTHCDDDSGGGGQPEVRAPLGPGDHAVWVGTFQEGAEASFTLEAAAESLSALPGPNGIAVDAAPSIDTLEIGPGARRERVRGTARGVIAASGVSPTCRGFVDPAPHLGLELAEPTELDITTEGRADLTMVVQHSDGQGYCDDDSGRGGNPRVRAPFPPGTVRVWIGTYQAGEEHDFALTIGARGK